MGLIQAFLISLTPIGELRAGIPYGILSGLNPFLVYIVCVAANLIIFPIGFLFLETMHTSLNKMNWYRTKFEKIEERSRDKINKAVIKWGYFGLLIFVAIPFPLTGAYTAAIGAWTVKLEFKKALLMASIGVLISGVIVTTATLTGVHFFT